MTVRQRLMAVPVIMRAAYQQLRVMRMLMMSVMDMRVRVFQKVVGMRVAVLLGQVQPEAQRHQGGGEEQLRVDRLA